MTTNISLRIPIDLIASADLKLTKQGQSVNSVNELIRVVLLNFVTDQSEIDEFAAFKHYERRFKRVKQPAKVVDLGELAREVHSENKEK